MVWRAIPSLVALAGVALAAGHYLFTSFRGDGAGGVYFALSEDGYRWTPVRANQPAVAGQHPGMLMRDPFLAQGPDKAWRMLWTTGWTRAAGTNRLTIGYASSRDLVHWGQQELIEIPTENARNAWAPEAVWDQKSKEWILIWASTVAGLFPDSAGTGDNGYNHRIWAMRTQDFRRFSKPELFFDPGFNCIDSTVVKVGRKWLMVFKDERRAPLRKNLRLAWTDRLGGGWAVEGGPFSKAWVEGPSVLKIERDWMIYFDHYAKPQHYGAYRTRDWKRFEDVTGQVAFPEGHRHGTAVRISEAEAEYLKAWR